MAVIKQIHSYSPFYRKIKRGDELIKINGKPVKDFLDYMFFESELKDENGDPVAKTATLTVLRNGKEHSFTEKVEEGEFFLEFENDLMDAQKACHNKCIFCFIDQMPKNMRETLYYKDDDFRLSLIYGNYITMTNLSDDDIDRIIRLRISPLNLSVHTTNPELRVKMMANPRAAKINENLQKIFAAGLNMRCQIVLCKGINDGKELDRSLSDLKNYYPSVSSVSVVPVGLTKFRDGLFPLEPFEKEDAKKVIEQINKIGDECEKEFGVRIFYPADEFYLKAEIPFPDYSYYGDFEQIENGVGMTASFIHDFDEALADCEPDKSLCGEFTAVTGVLIEGVIKDTCEKLKEKFPNINVKVKAIRNEFFGEKITVAGLVTGQDIIKQLKEEKIGDALLVPDTMLRDGEVFLDDITVSDIQKELGVKIDTLSCSGDGFLYDLISAAENKAR